MPAPNRRSQMITLTTDFGAGSPYVAQMKGVIYSINPGVQLVDLTHQIPPQNIRQAAMVLDDCCWRFPRDSIHVCVVDPGVGTEREIVLVRAGGHWFIAPDNGVLSLIVRRSRPERQFRLTSADFWLDEPSSTFHGRDIMGPVAAHLSLGTAPDQLGRDHPRLIEIDWPAAEIEPGGIRGEVLSIDSFGNVITNIESGMLPAETPRDQLQVCWRDEVLGGLVQTYGQRPDRTPVALIGSSGRLEVAVVNGNAADQLLLQVGDEVRVTWR